MSRGFRNTLAVLSLVVLAGGCGGDSPTDFDGDAQAALLPVHLSHAAALATLTIEVTAPDIEEPLVFNVEVVDGVASDTIVVPAGSDRLIVARAYDAGGIETHRGEETVSLAEALNPALTIHMHPLVGSQPIVVVVGSIAVEVTATVDTLLVGGTTTLVAVVTDHLGDTLAVDVNWATLAPAVATVTDDGEVTGVGAGAARIVATYGGVGASFDLTVIAPSPYLGSLSFDGTNDYVNFGAVAGFDPNSSVSLEVVFRWDGPNSNAQQQVMRLSLQSGGLAFGKIDSSGVLQFRVAQCNCSDDDQSLTEFSPAAGEWYRVLYTYDVTSGHAELFVDGTLVDQANYPFTGYYSANSSNSTLGAYSFLNVEYFGGDIAFARVVNEVVAPSAVPVEEPVHPATIYHVDFGDGSGATLTDLSSNGNHGTISGAVWSSEVPVG